MIDIHGHTSQPKGGRKLSATDPCDTVQILELALISLLHTRIEQGPEKGGEKRGGWRQNLNELRLEDLVAVEAEVP